MSVGVCLCLFRLWMSGGVSIDLGDIFGMPKLLGFFLETHSMRDSLRLEPTHYFGPTLKGKNFSPTFSETSKYQNLTICHL